MTKPIEGVSEKILACAKEEFLEKGYSEASLRTIAAKADTTTGSIYSRFGDKEGLFGAIVEPVAEGLTRIFLKTQEEFHAREAEVQPKVMETYVASGMDEMLDYVYDHFEEFRLLLDASYGTRYQNFVEHLVEIETEYTYKYMEATASLQEGSEITEEFVHITARAMFDSMFEVVRHRMDRDTARKYLPPTSFISCSIRRIVISKCSLTKRMVSISSSVSLGFIPAAGSSNRRSLGLVASALAISNFLCLP